MHRDDHERYSKYWSDDVGQRRPGERGYEDYRGGGEHVGGFYGQESSFGREERGRESHGDRGQERGARSGRDEPRGYDRWSGPERGRQGYPGSAEERFGPGGYDRERSAEQGYGREESERRDYNRRELGRQEYERRGYGGQSGARDREPDRRYGYDRGRDYGEQGFERGGYGFQSPDQRAYDQGRSQGRGYDEDRYGPGFYDRERRPDRSFGGRSGGGRDWSERPNEYGQEHFGGSAHVDDYGFRQGYRQPERYQAPMFQDEGRFGERGDDRWRSGGRSYAEGRYEQDQSGEGRYARQDQGMRLSGQPDYARDIGQLDQGWRDDWRHGGSHAGRGPRSYRRSDERIRDDVCEVLTRHPEIDASDIEIDVRDGEVTLRGVVDSRRTRRLAEDAIESRPGVLDVHNELRLADRLRASAGDPSRAGAAGSDTGKVEVTGNESGSPHATPTAVETAPGSTALGHTYQGTGMGTGGVDSGTWMGAGGGPQRTGTGGGIGGGATGSGVMNPGRDVGGMPHGMATGSDLGSIGQSGTRGTGNISPGRSGDLGGAAGSVPGELGTGTLGSGQVGNTSAVGTGTTMTGGMAAGSAGTVSTGGTPGVGTTGAGTSGTSGGSERSGEAGMPPSAAPETSGETDG